MEYVGEKILKYLFESGKYNYKFDHFCDLTGIYVIRFKIKIAYYLRTDKI